MKITHNFALSVSKKIQREFQSIGISLEEEFSSFKIDESDEKWSAASRLVQKYDAVDTVMTKFSAKELKSTNKLRMVADWHHGYPEPSDDFGYLESTYDIANYCKSCGTGLVQKAPFRFAKEPKWGTKNILQLNWVFDEFFIRSEIWEKVFKPLGIQCGDVLHDRSSKKIENVVQLIIPEANVSLKLESSPSESCRVCGRVKYLPITRGFFPSLDGGTESTIFKTTNYFGSGAEAHKAVVISKAFYLLLLEYKLKGVSFAPLLK